MDLPLAVMITIPEPWANNDTISQEKRDFYQYYATMMEPWDCLLYTSDFVRVKITGALEYDLIGEISQ